MTHDRFEVVWPSGMAVTRPVDLATAVTDLNGKTICELWDDVFRGDQIYAILNEELRRRYPDIRIVDCQTMGNIDGTDERGYIANLPGLLRKYGCNVVVAAVGA